MKTVTASKFKAECLAILDEVAETGEQITVLKRGKAVARLVPVANDQPHPQAALLGSARVVGDILAPVVDPADWEALGEGAE